MDGDEILLALFLSFLMSVTIACGYNINESKKVQKEAIRAGLQQCQGIGNRVRLWQKECVVPKGK